MTEISWDSIILTCVYCGVLNHGSCYSVLDIINNACHVCGYCSVVYNVSCTEDSVKNIYSIRDLSQADWEHIEQEFFYKKAACVYMKNEHLGILGIHLRKEQFLQTHFDVNNFLAQKVI